MNRFEDKAESGYKKKIISGFDFATGLKINEFMKECGIESRFDVAEIISNLSRTLSNYNIRKENLEKIEIGVDAAISGENSSLTKIILNENEKQRAREAIMSKIKALI